MLWLERAGKFILFFAGLIVILDVVGQRAVERWAAKAKERREDFRGLHESLHDAWPSLKAAGRLARESVDGDSDDAIAVRKEALAALAARRTPSTLIDDVRYTFPQREWAAQQLIASRLEPEKAVRLKEYLREFHGFAARVRITTAVANTIVLALVIWAYWGNIALIVVGWISISGILFALGIPLMAPRVILWIRWAHATVLYRVAEAAKSALEHGGRPLRAVALALFIVGSLLDFLGTWK